MKAIKTYISVYPLWYRILVFALVPLTVIAMGYILFVRAGAINGFDGGITIGVSGGALVYSEMFGEWYTLGEICARKNSFGEVVLSSPRGRLFVKRFAYVDILRKVIGYPVIFMIQQLIAGIVNPGAESIMDGFFIGCIFALAIMNGMLILRKTKALAMRFVSLLAMGAIVGLFATPYIMVSNLPVKLIIGAVALLLSIGMAVLSVRSILKNAKEDYYD